MPKTKLKFKCIHCGSCCTDINTIVNLTYNDILRLKDGLNLNIDEIIEILGFYVFKEIPSEYEIKKMVIPPIETENGLAFVGLRKYAHGNCIFYDEKQNRCPIYSIRPNFCRTFPFTFKLSQNREKSLEDRLEVRYTDKALEYCKGIDDSSPDIDIKAIKKLGKQVIEDLARNNVLIQEWNQNVNNKKIIPTVRNFILTILNIKGN